MPKLAKSVTVKRPVHEVFAFVEEPKHLPEIWPSLYEVRSVEMKPNIRRFQWLYNFAGKHISGKTETIERVLDKKIVEKAEGEIESVFTWKFAKQNGHTKLAFEADYKLPTGLEPKLQKFAVKRNELEAKLMLESLKARLEI